MFCSECGKEIQDDARFCANCGAVVCNPEVMQSVEQTSIGEVEQILDSRQKMEK